MRNCFIVCHAHELSMTLLQMTSLVLSWSCFTSEHAKLNSSPALVKILTFKMAQLWHLISIVSNSSEYEEKVKIEIFLQNSSLTP